MTEEVYAEIHGFVEAALALHGPTFISVPGGVRHPTIRDFYDSPACPLVACAEEPRNWGNSQAFTLAQSELGLSADAARSIIAIADALNAPREGFEALAMKQMRRLLVKGEKR